MMRVRNAVLCVLVLALVIFFMQWRSLIDGFYQVTDPSSWISRQHFAHEAHGCLDDFSAGNSTHDFSAGNSTHDFSAGNSTLGFQAIVALSQGTKWRVDGLQAAAAITGIQIQVPAQPVWSQPFIDAFKAFGPVDLHGTAMAWLGHLDLLKFVIQNRWGSALIIEDDADWDLKIREQTLKTAEAVRKLIKAEKQDVSSSQAPYGLDWDVLWLGHCSDPPHDLLDPETFVRFADNTTGPISDYRGLDPHIKEVVKDGERLVHWSVNPICTFAYAVSAVGAVKLLEHASLGKGGAFDLMLMHACQDRVLRCVSVNPEIFDPYTPTEGGGSEVRAGDAGTDVNKDAGQAMGQTNNILHSARCNALFQSDCK